MVVQIQLSMWNKGEVEQAFNKFGKETIQQARTNLTKGNHNVSKGLYNELSFKYEGSPNSFRFTLSAPEYWKYLDQGVKAVKAAQKHLIRLTSTPTKNHQ